MGAVGVNRDSTAVRPDGALGNRQPEPDPLDVLAARLVDPVESLEEPGQMDRLDAAALVADAEQLARALATKLVTYGTGRAPDEVDQPQIEAIVRNAAKRAAELDASRIAGRWAEFLEHAAVPAYHEWRGKSPGRRRAFLSMRPLHYAKFTAADLGARSLDFVRKEFVARLP